MWQPVLMIDGFILSVLGLTMLIPAAFDIYEQKLLQSPFLTASFVTIFIGMTLFLASKVRINRISLKQGYLVTCACWLSVAVFASIPFYLYGIGGNISSALFEGTSGITGTGATVVFDVEALPRSVLIWRSILNGLGGIGNIIFAVAMLPFLGIGGMQIFQRENADTGDKFMPRFVDMAKWIIVVYLCLVMLCAVLLHWCGMGWYDAVNHALSAVATGGFSTKNDSIAYFDSATIETVISLFMIIGSLPITFYIILLRNHEIEPFRFGQAKQFLQTVLLLVLLIALWLSLKNDVPFLTSLRWSSFNIISVITTTGFASTDFLSWGIWTAVFFSLLSLHGGCIGSTTGSVKTMRWQVLFSYIHKVIASAVNPNRVVPVKVGEVPVADKVVISVLVYILLFFITIAICAISLNFMGYDFTTSLSAAIASITNTGPGIATEIGIAGNYAFFSPMAKLLLCAAMMFGRLEILTLLVVFTPSFWKN